MTWAPDVCVYHFPCDDGFGAAWAVRRKWPGVILAPSNYGLPFPEKDIDGRDFVYSDRMNLLIADFSYKPDVLADLARRFKSIVILDHHKGAAEDLAGVPGMEGGDHRGVSALLDRDFGASNVVAEFDMQQSGAMLAWRFCFPGEPVPLLIEHIADRDLWRFKLEHTRKLSLLLRSFDYDLDMWNIIAEGLEHETDRLRWLGEAVAIERFYDRRIADIADTATLRKLGEHDGVPVAHAPYSFVSDVAHVLLERHPEAPFAAVIVDAYGGRTWSLRSEDSRVDVSAVARGYGGGGHRNAAGFRMP